MYTYPLRCNRLIAGAIIAAIILWIEIVSSILVILVYRISKCGTAQCSRCKHNKLNERRKKETKIRKLFNYIYIYISVLLFFGTKLKANWTFIECNEIILTYCFHSGHSFIQPAKWENKQFRGLIYRLILHHI